MSLKKYSKKLTKYLRKIETDTGREVKIQEFPPSELYKMKSAFVHHPIYILILIASGSETPDPELEQSIAHEAMHGFLVYKMKYCLGFYKRTPTEVEKKLVTLLFTMVSDIVVNRLIQHEGFLPYSPKYPSTTNDEINAMKNGINPYGLDSADPTYRARIMVFRYILAWGYTKFITLNEDVHEILLSFMNEFKFRNPNLFKMALKIQNIILLHDIFSSDGFRKAIEELLSLWELDSLVELRTV